MRGTIFLLTLFAALAAWFGPRRLTVRAAATLWAAWFAAGLALAPVLLGYRTVQAAYGFKRSPVEILNYSADVAGLWSAAPDSLLWRWLHGAGVSSESEQFPGLAILVLAAVAIALAVKRHAHRREVAFYACTAVVMWTLSLGPAPKLNGVAIGIPGPYAALASIPGFDGMRVTARLWMVAVVCLSACAAIACGNRVERAKWLVAAAAARSPRRLAARDPVSTSADARHGIDASARLGLPP